MDTPIISPWILYFIGVCGTIKGLFGLILAFTCMALGVSFMCCLATMSDCSEEEHSISLRAMKISCLSLLIAVITCITVPSQRTCYQMLVASYITPRNIQVVGETADKTLDKLMDKIVETSNKLGDKYDKAKSE